MTKIDEAAEKAFLKSVEKVYEVFHYNLATAMSNQDKIDEAVERARRGLARAQLAQRLWNERIHPPEGAVEA